MGNLSAKYYQVSKYLNDLNDTQCFHDRIGSFARSLLVLADLIHEQYSLYRGIFRVIAV